MREIVKLEVSFSGFNVTTSPHIDHFPTKIPDFNTISKIINNIRRDQILLDDDDENEKLGLSNANSTPQKNYLKIAIKPSTLRYWEMQRNDSDQSIIKVTTAFTPVQITTKDQLYQTSITENGNTIDDDSNNLNSNGNWNGFITFK